MLHTEQPTPSPGEEPFQGLPSNICRRCGRGLSNKTSINHGYGPVCFSKVRAGDVRRAKVIEHYEPRTITDKGLAAKTIAAIYRLIDRITPESAGWNGRCVCCGTTIHEMPLESFDHDGGQLLPGFGKPQWFYLHDDHNDLAIWKIRITDFDILVEMDSTGDLPPEFKDRLLAKINEGEGGLAAVPFDAEKFVDSVCEAGISLERHQEQVNTVQAQLEAFS